MYCISETNFKNILGTFLINHLVLVIQKLDHAIHRINAYPVDNC